MTLLEARDCIIDGIGTDPTSSLTLRAMPVSDRAEALYWIQEHLDRDKLEQGAVVAVDDVLSGFTEKARNTEIEVGKILIVLQQLQRLLVRTLEAVRQPEAKSNISLMERLNETKNQAHEARKDYDRVLYKNEGRSPRERVRNANNGWKKMRDFDDMWRAVEDQAEAIAKIYAKEQGLPAPNNLLERRVIWEKIGCSWTEYDVPLRLPGIPLKPSEPRLDQFEVAAKELSASEAMQLEKATGKALEWLDEQLDAGEITDEQYQNARSFIFDIGLDAHQTSEAIIDELVLDFMKKQDDDWSRPMDDIYAEWREEQASDEPDEPEGPML